MIERDRGLVTFECNGCHEVLETNTAAWDMAKAIFDREGWMAKSVGGGEWAHYCRDCKRIKFRGHHDDYSHQRRRN